LSDEKSEGLRAAALFYHEHPKPGKLEIRATKPLANGRDLSRAYSPGVAEASLEIKADPANAARYTARGNLVAVVSNGSAVLGLGNIGALASKPVMEGKAVLFKKFANIDCFDLEVDESDPEKLADIVCALEPSFGAINLEDIKAPDCFIVERICRERMNIPVFHDDQHGTAIVVGAAATNALRIAGKRFEDIKVVSTGGGAAGIACLNMLLKLGVRRENVWLCDLAGLVYEGREEQMTPQKAEYAQGTTPATLGDVIEGADLFLGLSGPGVLTPTWSRHGRETRRLRARQSHARDPARRCPRRRAGRDHRHGAERFFPTRSTTSCAFPSSSAARSMSARPRSTTPCRSPASRGSRPSRVPPPAPRPPPPTRGSS
jgi:malate dehydrogenase (oxaloacetate-decarboxylating)(NADP+)